MSQRTSRSLTSPSCPAIARQAAHTAAIVYISNEGSHLDRGNLFALDVVAPKKLKHQLEGNWISVDTERAVCLGEQGPATWREAVRDSEDTESKRKREKKKADKDGDRRRGNRENDRKQQQSEKEGERGAGRQKRKRRRSGIIILVSMNITIPRDRTISRHVSCNLFNSPSAFGCSPQDLSVATEPRIFASISSSKRRRSVQQVTSGAHSTNHG